MDTRSFWHQSRDVCHFQRDRTSINSALNAIKSETVTVSVCERVVVDANKGRVEQGLILRESVAVDLVIIFERYEYPRSWKCTACEMNRETPLI